MWKDIANAARQALVGLAGSKKTWTALMAAISAGLLRLGFEVDANTVGLVLTPFVSLILGQAYQDRKHVVAGPQ